MGDAAYSICDPLVFFDDEDTSAGIPLEEFPMLEASDEALQALLKPENPPSILGKRLFTSLYLFVVHHDFDDGDSVLNTYENLVEPIFEKYQDLPKLVLHDIMMVAMKRGSSNLQEESELTTEMDEDKQLMELNSLADRLRQSTPKFQHIFQNHRSWKSVVSGPLNEIEKVKLPPCLSFALLTKLVILCELATSESSDKNMITHLIEEALLDDPNFFSV